MYAFYLSFPSPSSDLSRHCAHARCHFLCLRSDLHSLPTVALCACKISLEQQQYLSLYLSIFQILTYHKRLIYDKKLM